MRSGCVQSAFGIRPFLRMPALCFYCPSDGFNPFCGVITQCNESKPSTGLKSPFSVPFFRRCSAVALHLPRNAAHASPVPRLFFSLSLAFLVSRAYLANYPLGNLIPRIEENPFTLSPLCRIARASIVLHGTKKGHPREIYQLSGVPLLSPGRWNGFLERMFFCTDIITRLSAVAKSIFYVLSPSVLCLCSRMPLCAPLCPSDGVQLLSRYSYPFGI